MTDVWADRRSNAVTTSEASNYDTKPSSAPTRITDVATRTSASLWRWFKSSRMPASTTQEDLISGCYLAYLSSEVPVTFCPERVSRSHAIWMVVSYHDDDH
jgi:hypothetical protein